MESNREIRKKFENIFRPEMPGLEKKKGAVAGNFQDFTLPNSGCFLTQFQVRDYVPEVIWTLGVTSTWRYGVAKMRFFKVIFGHTSPRCRTTCPIYGTSGALTRF